MDRQVYKGSIAVGIVALAALGLYLVLRDSDGQGSDRSQVPRETSASEVAYQPFSSDGFPLPRECEPRRVATTVLEFLAAGPTGDRRRARAARHLRAVQPTARGRARRRLRL